MTIRPEIIGLLYTALRAEYGILVRTDHPERLRPKLYEARRTDPDLAVLSVVHTSSPNEFFIVKTRRIISDGTDPEAHS